MTTDHRAEAERLLASADTSIAAALEKTLPLGDQQHAAVLAGILTNRALGHAMLAQGQESAADASALRAALIVWRDIVSHAVAWNLSFAETDEQHEQWAELAHQLEKAGLDIRSDVDRITPDFDKNPNGVWNPPSLQRKAADWRAAFGSPWDPPKSTAARKEQALKADPGAWAYLGREIRKFRERQNLSRRALSERADVSEKSIQVAEEGRVPAGRWPQSLNRITEALGMGAEAALDLVLNDPSRPPF
jgi:DNA-binding XRE family transcriptional regulator